MLKKRLRGKAVAIIAFSLVFLLTFSYFSHPAEDGTAPQRHASSKADAAYSAVSFIGPISGSAQNYTGSMNVAIIFNFSHQNALQLLLNNLSNPLNPQYGHYLTISQFDSEFSPDASVYNSAISYFEQYGLWDQQTFSNRLILSITGAAHNFSEAFHTNITSSSTGGTIGYSPSSVPELPSWLSGSISSVVGLSSIKPNVNLNLAGAGAYNQTAAANLSYPPSTQYTYPPMVGSNGIQYLYGSYFQQAYNEGPLLTKVYPTNEVIATILWGGSYTSNGNTINTGAYNPSDISYYFNNYLPSGQPIPKIYGVPINGAVAPGTSAENDTTGAAVENTLDLEMAGSLAPGASIYNVYGPNSTFVDLIDSLETVLSPPAGYSGLDNVSVISNSWGTNDTLDNTWNQLLQESQARGITVLASTGDSGNDFSSSKSVSNTEWVQFPSTISYDTYGVVAVGGTNLSLDPQTLSLQSEQAWYMPASSNSGDTLGTVGGISNVYNEPSWQVNSQANTVIKNEGRGVPDVSAVANNTIIYYSNTTFSGRFIVSGTSISAPVVGGMIAEMDAYRANQGVGPLGFINPSIYMLGTEQYGNSGISPALPPFYDVTLGHNYVYQALTGYDLVTGMGSINAYNFLTDLSGKKYNVSFRESGMDPANNWSVNVSGTTYYSHGAYVNLSVINGTYYYNVPVVGYNVSDPVAGKFTVDGSNVVINLVFKRGYLVAFNENSLPLGTGWSIFSWNYTASTFTQQIKLYFPNGTYNYTVTPADPNYYGSSGNFTVKGTERSVQVNFTHGIFNVTFIEIGLPPNHIWYVSTSGQEKNSTSDTIRFTLLGGEYTFSIPPTGHYIANHTSITINTNGQNQTVYLNFSYGYYITFNATGVPAGVQWTLLIADYNISSQNSTIVVELQNGTYDFDASYNAFGTNPHLTGNVTVNGQNLTVHLDFSTQRTPFDYYILYITLFVLGIAILLIGVLILRKK